MRESCESLAWRELAADAAGRFLSDGQKYDLVRDCLARGRAAALDSLRRKGADIASIVADEGIAVVRTPEACANPAQILFSEYYPKQRRIILFSQAIAGHLRRLSECGVAARASELEAHFLAHEYFHHLECTALGITYRQYRIKTRNLLFFQMHAHVRAASEIAAHAFVETMMESAAGRVWQWSRFNSSAACRFATNATCWFSAAASPA